MAKPQIKYSTFKNQDEIAVKELKKIVCPVCDCCNLVKNLFFLFDSKLQINVDLTIAMKCQGKNAVRT